MSDKPFYDTNVLLYAFGRDDLRSEPARLLLAEGGTISVQSLNEFVSVARRKFGMSWKEVQEATAAISILCPSPVPLSFETHKTGLRIAEQYGYHIYDSLVIAAALEAGCSKLYSEDLHDGQGIEGLTIQNPFSSLEHSKPQK